MCSPAISVARCCFYSFHVCVSTLIHVPTTAVTRAKMIIKPTYPYYTTARSSRRFRSSCHFVCPRPSNASVGSGSHKLGHGHTGTQVGHPSSHQNKRSPSYPSCKIRPSIAWRLLARTPIKRPLAWGRLIEALFSPWPSVRPLI